MVLVKNMTKRFTDGRENQFSITLPTNEDPILIACPKCKKMAKVLPNPAQPEDPYSAKAICVNCGFSKIAAKNTKHFHWGEENPKDGYFDFPIWMVIACCGHSLWAYNGRHLDFLDKYVQAELREKPKDGLGIANSSLSSRLPKWMKAKSNRKQIIVGLEKLRELGMLNSK